MNCWYEVLFLSRSARFAERLVSRRPQCAVATRRNRAVYGRISLAEKNDIKIATGRRSLMTTIEWSIAIDRLFIIAAIADGRHTDEYNQALAAYVHRNVVCRNAGSCFTKVFEPRTIRTSTADRRNTIARQVAVKVSSEEKDAKVRWLEKNRDPAAVDSAAGANRSYRLWKSKATVHLSRYSHLSWRRARAKTDGICNPSSIIRYEDCSGINCYQAKKQFHGYKQMGTK